jgi:hypothetical protein
MPELHITTLAENTAFLSLKFKTFGNVRRVDLDAILDVDPLTKLTADQRRFKHQKLLLDSPELKLISSADAAIRVRIEHLCCLTSDIGLGSRLIPLGYADDINTILAEYETVTRPALVEQFIAVYPDQAVAAQPELREKWENDDYPTVENMRKEFSFTFRIYSQETPEVLRLTHPEVYEAMRDKSAQFLMDAASEVAQAMRAAAYELVTQLADGLSGKKNADGKSRRLTQPSLVVLQEFLNTFDIRNVTDDTALKVEMDKLRLIMNGVDVEKIRQNDGLKVDLTAKVGEIANSVATLVEVKGRKFRDAPEPEPEPELAIK